MTPGLLLVGLVLVLHAGVLAIVIVNRVDLRRSLKRRTAPAERPRVSVLVPARNEEDNLRRLLPSLLAQTYPHFEIVVLDDGSDDATWEVLEHHADPRLLALRGSGPPPGWVGKVHALYAATRRASGEVFIFLDADAELTDPGAIERLVERWAAAGGEGSAVTGLPRYLDRSAAALLTSLVPFAVLAGLPVPLIPRTQSPGLSALNGQIWVLGAPDYRRLEPHASMPAEVLEDVKIGRFLKRNGIRLHFVDLQTEVRVLMYRSFGEAWRGFRKNAYLIAGGRPLPFAFFFTLYLTSWVAPTAMAALWLAGALPFGWLPILTLLTIKGLIDRYGRFPWIVSLLAPVSLTLGAALMLDSAWAHFRGTVAWKGRTV